jgi:PIN domain nuclease of toxin-antitoxin system
MSPKGKEMKTPGIIGGVGPEITIELFVFPKKLRRDPVDRIIVASACSRSALLTYDQGFESPAR